MPPMAEVYARLDAGARVTLGTGDASKAVVAAMLWRHSRRPTLLIAAMFRALDAFRIFDLVFVLTGGGPADSTETLSTLIYKQLFSALQVGFGSALATLLFATEVIIAGGFGVMIARKLRQTS